MRDRRYATGRPATCRSSGRRQPARARLPVGPRRVVPQAAVQLPGPAAVLALEHGRGGDAGPQDAVLLALADEPDAIDGRARRPRGMPGPSDCSHSSASGSSLQKTRGPYWPCVTDAKYLPVRRSRIANSTTCPEKWRAAISIAPPRRPRRTNSPFRVPTRSSACVVGVSRRAVAVSRRASASRLRRSPAGCACGPRRRPARPVGPLAVQEHRDVLAQTAAVIQDPAVQLGMVGFEVLERLPDRAGLQMELSSARELAERRTELQQHHRASLCPGTDMSIPGDPRLRAHQPSARCASFSRGGTAAIRPPPPRPADTRSPSARPVAPRRG